MTILSKEVTDNLFYGAHQAAFDLLPGLRFMGGRVDAGVPHSSQALALDVFGTLKHAKSRDRICDCLAVLLEVPEGGPWAVELEYTDPDNVLHELQHKTQADVRLRGARSLIVLESKFAETKLEPCSQPGKTKNGSVQCTGNYEPQTNPINGRSASCALTGKGIRYWEYIPQIFNLDPDAEHRPCPFAGSSYQWMRTLVLASALAEKHKLKPAAALVFADRPIMPIAARFGDQDSPWSRMTAGMTGAVRFERLSYEKLPGMFEAVAEKSDQPMFRDLHYWVKAKVNWVEARLRNARVTRKPQKRR
jgi:hypothetical protein